MKQCAAPENNYSLGETASWSRLAQGLLLSPRFPRRCARQLLPCCAFHAFGIKFSSVQYVRRSAAQEAVVDVADHHDRVPSTSVR
jgi:hypothetical protein